MRYCVLRTKAWPDWYHLFGEKQTPFPFICVSVCKGEISCKYSIQEAASKTPAYRTRTEPEDVKLKSYMRWLFLIHPLGPFSHCDFHSKDSYPSPYVPCIMCETWEWKSETTQNQMVNFKMATMTREISRPSFVWRPFTCAPVSSRTFFVVFQLWQPVGNQRAAILIFVIHIYTIELVCSTRKLMISFNWSMKLMVVLDN